MDISFKILSTSPGLLPPTSTDLPNPFTPPPYKGESYSDSTTSLSAGPTKADSIPDVIAEPRFPISPLETLP